MSTPEERVARMVENGTVSPEEGAALLAELERRRERPRWWRALQDPLQIFTTEQVLAASTVVALASLALGAGLDVRFDGAFDVHVGGEVSLLTALMDQLLAWPLTAAIAFGVAWLFGARARFVDLLAAVGAARSFLAVTGLVVGLMAPFLPLGGVAGDVGWALLLAGLTLPLVIAFFVALVKSFRTATGLTGVPLGRSPSSSSPSSRPSSSSPWPEPPAPTRLWPQTQRVVPLTQAASGQQR